jgi:hypothetical protein
MYRTMGHQDPYAAIRRRMARKKDDAHEEERSGRKRVPFPNKARSNGISSGLT